MGRCRMGRYRLRIATAASSRHQRMVRYRPRIVTAASLNRNALPRVFKLTGLPLEGIRTGAR
jgi:hypothetical protein